MPGGNQAISYTILGMTTAASLVVMVVNYLHGQPVPVAVMSYLGLALGYASHSLGISSGTAAASSGAAAASAPAPKSGNPTTPVA